MSTKIERLIFLESMAKRLTKKMGPLTSVCVGWSYTTDGSELGLPAREGGYGLVSVLVRPGRKHVTFAGDRSLAREVEVALSGEQGDRKFSSLNSKAFDFFRAGWYPEWPDETVDGAWKPTNPVCGVDA